MTKKVIEEKDKLIKSKEETISADKKEKIQLQAYVSGNEAVK